MNPSKLASTNLHFVPESQGREHFIQTARPFG
jgi:hypothetical protein